MQIFISEPCSPCTLNFDLISSGTSNWIFWKLPPHFVFPLQSAMKEIKVSRIAIPNFHAQLGLKYSVRPVANLELYSISWLVRLLEQVSGFDAGRFVVRFLVTKWRACSNKLLWNFITLLFRMLFFAVLLSQISILYGKPEFTFLKLIMIYREISRVLWSMIMTLELPPQLSHNYWQLE